MELWGKALPVCRPGRAGPAGEARPAANAGGSAGPTALRAVSGIDSFVLWVRQKTQPDPVGGD